MTPMMLAEIEADGAGECDICHVEGSLFVVVPDREPEGHWQYCHVCATAELSRTVAYLRYDAIRYGQAGEVHPEDPSWVAWARSTGSR